MAAGLSPVLVLVALLGAMVVGLPLLAAIALAWACQTPLRPGRHRLAVDVNERFPAREGASSWTIMSWNIAWAYGWGSELSDNYQPRDRADFDARLAEIAARIREVDPDVVLLQEVDLGASRSHDVDQAAWLQHTCGFRFLVRAPSWDLRYLPFPTWPPARNAGRLRSGAAILSRVPLADAEQDLWPKSPRLPFLRRLFYLHRYALWARLAPQGPVVFTTHLDAFSRETRAEEVQALIGLLPPGPVVLMGDFNVPPPEAEVLAHYPDEPDTDHREDRIHAQLRAAGLQPALPGGSGCFTFPAHAPNRMLDHAFVRGPLRVEHGTVVPSPGAPSDHLPIVVRIVGT